MYNLGGRNIVEAEVRSKQSNFCAQIMPLKLELLQQEPTFNCSEFDMPHISKEQTKKKK